VRQAKRRSLGRPYLKHRQPQRANRHQKRAVEMAAFLRGSIKRVRRDRIHSRGSCGELSGFPKPLVKKFPYRLETRIKAVPTSKPSREAQKVIAFLTIAILLALILWRIW